MADPPGRTPFDVFREADTSGGIEFPRDEDTQARSLSNVATVTASPEKPPSPLTHTYLNGAPVASFGRSLGLGTRDVIEGALSLPTTALDLGTWPGRAAVRAAGGTATAPSDMLHNALTYIGLP